MKKFKVGDWVRIIDGSGLEEHSIHKLDKEKLYLVKQLYRNSVELWQPAKGEWCWFDTTSNTLPFIAKYGEFNNEEYFIDNSTFIKKHNIKTIEPFIGELPSFIKDR